MTRSEPRRQNPTTIAVHLKSEPTRRSFRQKRRPDWRGEIGGADSAGELGGGQLHLRMRNRAESHKATSEIVRRIFERLIRICCSALELQAHVARTHRITGPLSDTSSVAPALNDTTRSVISGRDRPAAIFLRCSRNRPAQVASPRTSLTNGIGSIDTNQCDGRWKVPR